MPLFRDEDRWVENKMYLMQFVKYFVITDTVEVLE